ncbi:hypothetical protein SORBI_3008G155300, partial [Sorghum bicolor]
MAADLADAGRGWRGRAGRAGGVWHPVRDSVRARAAAHARRRALLPLTGQAGIGFRAGRDPDMAAANREFDQLSTMATALVDELVV